jgi:hypothetical protein
MFFLAATPLPVLSGKAQAALGAAAGDHAAAGFGGHTGAETMTALANQAAGLIGTFHGLLLQDFSNNHNNKALAPVKATFLKEKGPSSQSLRHGPAKPC